MTDSGVVDTGKKDEIGSAPDGNILQHIKSLEQNKAQLE
jgi:hypothetical protein